jgi:hypothetical protein
LAPHSSAQFIDHALPRPERILAAAQFLDYVVGCGEHRATMPQVWGAEPQSLRPTVLQGLNFWDEIMT